MKSEKSENGLPSLASETCQQCILTLYFKRDKCICYLPYFWVLLIFGFGIWHLFSTISIHNKAYFAELYLVDGLPILSGIHVWLAKNALTHTSLPEKRLK